MTNAEEILWHKLRDRKFAGVKFRRQVPIGSYIADFACVTRKLIVECDGQPHESEEQQTHDQRRDAWLRSQGWRVMRIPNDLIIGGSLKMLDDIRTELRLPSSDPR